MDSRFGVDSIKVGHSKPPLIVSEIWKGDFLLWNIWETSRMQNTVFEELKSVSEVRLDNVAGVTGCEVQSQLLIIVIKLAEGVTEIRPFGGFFRS